MKRPLHYLLKTTAVLFVIGIMAFQAPVLFGQEDTLQIQAAKSFRVTPKKDAAYYWVGAVFNPNLDNYVVFFYAYKYEPPALPEQTIYSQMFTRRGNKAGPLNKLATLQGAYDLAPHLDITLNETENEILVVWTYNFFDSIKAMTLCGDGSSMPSGCTNRIKPSTGIGTGISPKIAWIPSRNHYALAWSCYDQTNTKCPDNGFYLSILKPKLNRKLKPHKVKQTTMKRDIYYIHTLLPLEDRLFWGAAQDSKKYIKPVVWFTDFQGETITVPGADGDGSIHPGPKVPGGGQVFADYNPIHDQFLLMWDAADHRSQFEATKTDTYYRIMNSDGSFAMEAQRMPKKRRFHHSAVPLYNPVTNNFFAVYIEHRLLYRPDPFAEYQGGRLWTTFIDSYGEQGLPGKTNKLASPLSGVFTDTHTGSILLETVYNPVHNEYLVLYLLADYADNTNVTSGIWGTVLKNN